MTDIDKEISALVAEIRGKTEVCNDHKKPSEDGKKGSCNLSKGSANNELLQFFLGFLLLGGGVYWVLNSFTVTSSWGSGFSFFGMGINSGVMLIPLLLGIGMMFFMEKKAIGGCVAALGLLVILISLITSVSFHARYNTLYVYVLMFGMIAAGTGLLIKTLFKNNKEK